MQNQRILVVDDETSLRTALFRALDQRGYQVITAGSKAEAFKMCQVDRPFDLVLVDLKLPDGDGLELMTELKSVHPHTTFIVLTGFATIEVAVEATRRGAYHFITKPFNLDEVLNIVNKVLSHKNLETENYQLRTALQKQYKFENIVGQSAKIFEVLEMVERVAESDSTVLITGESGTGKELIAKAIHFNSLRNKAPFIPINCGAIPGELLESELFGHVKGAFTGATQNRIGRFELAENGTIFFDEIGDMSANLQVKLLRVLQDRRFEPVGSTKTLSSNVRVIAATNIDLDQAVADGQFREDLFYRLNVIPIRVPALRERTDDIPLLISFFINKFNQNKKEPITGVSQGALEVLCNYNWPGNIRELENLMERMAIIKRTGIIDVLDLPEKYRTPSSITLVDPSNVEIPDSGMDFNSAVNNYENALIMNALEKTGWNRNQAATLLRLNRTTLVEKIKKKGLRPPEASA
ncbi:MAG: sigma-54-dependent Fis family transcriptional regulator [Bdellovibrionaceae bacterium]|nr:sigma-54-dependent Fis family transcriptional regulator [Pseudobdellovibrionaceae bacterium]